MLDTSNGILQGPEGDIWMEIFLTKRHKSRILRSISEFFRPGLRDEKTTTVSKTLDYNNEVLRRHEPFQGVLRSYLGRG